MKTFPLFLLPVALVFAFIGCSDGGSGGGGGGGGGGTTPDVNVNVSGCGNSVDGILQCAVNELKKERWDEAVAYYNAAYDKDNNNTKAIIYSTLANLAKISTDPKMASLMKEHFGFTTYPNRLNALLSDSWMKEYENEKLPAIKTPAWVQGKGSMYNNALLSNNAMSFENWAISLIANVLDKNSNGFNTLLDDVIEGVFGPSYNLAVERLRKLENKKEDRIKLDPYFIDQLDLREFFDEHDPVGWAEVNTILSATLLVKASLEWVQSYNLSTDLNWLKFAWTENTDDVLNRFKSVPVSSLPFKNNFFKERSGKIENSKADYIKAIKGFQSSYTSIIGSDVYPTKVKDSYSTINGGFEALINAIGSDGKFYIPEDPTKGTWPTTKRNDVKATVDLGKFFAPGYFSLEKIFKTNNGNPVFYAKNEVLCADYWRECEPDYKILTKSNYDNLMRDGRLALAINMGPFNAIFDEEDDSESFEYLDIGFDGKVAKALFEKYYP